MHVGSFILLLFLFITMLMMIQRTEARRRLLVTVGMLLLGVLVVRYVNYRSLHGEAQLAFVVALILTTLFWLLIGRYNPVRSSNDIKVLGMDD